MRNLKLRSLALAVAATAFAQTASAQLEEIIVTAQKVESSIQDTPIAISAFSQDQLDIALINDTMNLQFNVPNMLMGRQNFTQSDIRIRGIGSGAIGPAGDAGVGVHVNGVYLNSSRIFETQFLDTERVEVLRGPQGTLYGRNTTGGVINMITAKADTEAMSGSIDGTMGNYGATQVRGVLNVPIGDTLAARFAGMALKRDGFVDNIYTGNDIDDRDLYSTRLSLRWTPTEDTDINFMWSYFEEDDSRARSQKQACNKDPNGILGCLPGELGYGVAHSGGGIGGSLLQTIGAISAGGYGVYYALTGNPAFAAAIPGARFPLDDYADSVNPNDPRKVNMDYDPTYYAEENIMSLEITHDFGDYTFTSLTGYSESEVESTEDYEKSVASTNWNTQLAALAGWADIPALPAALAPALGALGAGSLVPFITDIATGIPGVGLWAGNPGMAALAQGVPMLLPDNSGYVNVFGSFGADNSFNDTEQWSQEFRIQSNFDGPVNFLAGAFYLDYEGETGYVVRSTALALPGLILPINSAVYPAPFGDPNDPYSESNPYHQGYHNDSRDYSLETWAVFGELYWDVSDQLRLTFGGRYTDETKEGKQRTLYVTFQDLPTVEPNNGYYFPEFEQDEFSWKFNATYTFNDDLMAYATVSSSFKSGGFNPIGGDDPLADPALGGDPSKLTFDPEFIDAFEVGFKSTLLDGNMQINAAAFYYDYQDLQQSKIVRVTSINENSDAEIMGLEAEMLWAVTNNFRLTANLSLLDTELKSFKSVNTANPANASDPAKATEGLVSVNGINYLIDYPGEDLCEQGNVDLGGYSACTGILVDMDGNSIAGAPEMSINLGASYTFELGSGMDLMVATNYYWQDEYYASNFNAAQDKVEEWEVWNASARLTGGDGKWYAEAWIKNILDEDYVTGQYLTSSVSSLFTNQFILDPQTYGLTVGYAW